MKIDGKAVGIGMLVVALGLALAFATRGGPTAHREKVWEAQWRRPAASIDDPFLGASRLLSQNGFRVQSVKAMEHLRQLPDGTVLLGGAEGVMTNEQSTMLLAWVARGNTLIFQPRAASKAELAIEKHAAAAHNTAQDGTGSNPAEPVPALPDSDAPVANPYEDGTEHDPLGLHLGVRWAYGAEKPACRKLDGAAAAELADTVCPPGTVYASALRALSFPGQAPVVVDVYNNRAVLLPRSGAPAWADSRSTTILGFRHGKGQIVVAPHQLFRNWMLQNHDNAALLLGLARLNGEHKHVTIVQSRQIVDWIELLWINYSKLLMALAALLALLFWAAVRRFGPVLPDAEPERRALMEHIAASGAWLWQAEGGRQVLLLAARTELEQTLQRRAPALLRLGQNSQHQELARLCGLPLHHVAHAMHDDAASQSADFTRQIRTLQTLRKHYER